MNARDFLHEHVRPTVKHWRVAPDELWRAMNAVLNLNQLADYRWHDLGARGALIEFRRALVNRCPSFQLIWDVADAHKHMKISRTERTLTSAGQASVVPVGWDDAEFGILEWGSSPEVVIYTDQGQMKRLKPVIEEVLTMWEAELTD